MLRTTKKPPPANKRHTKPCKYFQHGNCTLPAEVCNFAHVIVPAPVPTKNTVVCRYYSTGTCHNGSYCPYKHSAEADSPHQPRVHVVGQDPRSEWHTQSSPVENVYLDAPSPYGSYPSYSGYHHDWSYAAGINGQLPPSSGYPSNYISPSKPSNYSPSTGSKIASTFSPSPSLHFDVARGHHSHSHFTSRTNSNSTTISTTSVTSSGSDDTTSTTGSSSFSSSSTDPDVELIVATTEDPKYAEHAHEHQSQVVITDQPSPQHVSPYAAYPNLRTGTGGTYGYQPHRPASAGYKSHRGPNSSTPAGSRTTSRNSTKKPIKYKTKPCKFWAANGTCSAGDECTFRHDEPMPVAPPAYTTTQEQSPSSKALRPVEAPKPTRPTHKENFFPISWRVIGGGVLVGNNRREDRRPGSTASDDSIPSVPESPPEPIPPPNIEKATTTSLPRLQTPSTRKRSNSIPLTPSSSQVIVGNLFSAESPGVL